MTADQIRRLFFRRDRGYSARQTVNNRLKKLVDLGYLETLVVNAGRGAGPYAYGLTQSGRTLLQRPAPAGRRGSPGPVWHELEVADFRIRLQEALEGAGGQLVEWLGEPILRSLLVGRKGGPVPDALVHWRLPESEGTFFFEWDRGTESLAVLAAKITRYASYWRSRGHKELVPGLGLRPRLSIVLKSAERSSRLIRWLRDRPAHAAASTTLVAVADAVLSDPLGTHWWRSDTSALGTFFA